MSDLIKKGDTVIARRYFDPKCTKGVCEQVTGGVVVVVEDSVVRIKQDGTGKLVTALMGEVMPRGLPNIRFVASNCPCCGLSNVRVEPTEGSWRCEACKSIFMPYPRLFDPQSGAEIELQSVVEWAWPKEWKEK